LSTSRSLVASSTRGIDTLTTFTCQ
jgi:hypothetical protein